MQEKFKLFGFSYTIMYAEYLDYDDCEGKIVVCSDIGKNREVIFCEFFDNFKSRDIAISRGLLACSNDVLRVWE